MILRDDTFHLSSVCQYSFSTLSSGTTEGLGGYAKCILLKKKTKRRISWILTQLHAEDQCKAGKKPLQFRYYRGFTRGYNYYNELVSHFTISTNYKGTTIIMELLFTGAYEYQ